MDGLFDAFDETAPRAATPAKHKSNVQAVIEAVAEAGDKRLPPTTTPDDIEDNTPGGVKAELARIEAKKKNVSAHDSVSIPLSKMGAAFQKVSATPTVISGGSKDCLHEVAIPPGHEYTPFDETPAPEKPAKTYPFTLDPFQRVSVQCLERNESVLVSAHTSAGKTVVAEYAIAMSLRDGQRVIYTSPIKALSNQKYRELAEEFKDVGLMTGDTTINPSASCLVMTTEILRSMLYRGSEIMREVGWVVFDEIHYMRDANRGVVWEETLILLPDNVHYVFLSATIPNALQFAQWISHIHNQPCHVVYTDYRPTPLQHYIYPSGAEGLYLIVGPDGGFRDDNFTKAMASMQISGAANKGRAKGRSKGQSNISAIVGMIMKRKLHPCIVFSFSKRECETYAMDLSKLDFNTEDEKKNIELIFTNAIASLSEEDRALPSIENLLPLMKRGVGVHHSGLLPIMKEVTELLFGEGLVKVLFATETFAMGLNMPAKTVVFSNVKKFDGKEFRPLSSGEYIQMSGRAGRRGLDTNGIVILMMQEKLEPQNAKGMLQGQADKLNSAFRLTYNMVLNLLRVEEINPEYMLNKSFYKFQNTQDIPAMRKRVEELAAEHKRFTVDREDEVEMYHTLVTSKDTLEGKLSTAITETKHILRYLNPGRLVHVQDSQQDWGWGAVVNFQRKKPQQLPGQAQQTKEVVIVDVLLNCDATVVKGDKPRPCPANGSGDPQVIPVVLGAIKGLSRLCMRLPRSIKPADERKRLYKNIRETLRRKGPCPLHPVKEMKIQDEAIVHLCSQIDDLHQRIETHPLHKDENRESLLALFRKKRDIYEELLATKRQLKMSESIQQLDELKSRKRVLRRLKFCTDDDVIEMKGRVACEINTGDELLITEMIFNGVFNDLSVVQVVSLMSCFVASPTKDETPSKMKEELSGPFKQMQEMARRIAKVSIESRITLDEEEYVSQFAPDMMDIVNQWCCGARFSDICKITTMYEGSIIRSMRRLEELLRQMAAAAKAIGNSELEHKFAEGMSLIKRDIVFANSLYL
ncbi:DEAD/DEAH box helicase [Salpingoeca rosetta]|uniref:DEAD/DEAH box helicase n=1 Tax=Salpingoeca rosetta (strain ATCC 50818 / BSB-021) TaxID=946362 RepID=F2U2F3_SALR5|nr:DEAD/DEAH box helicase [Salpingoeca rosetta]EGD81805.1 DEAD/DEAH box helicase [Salpingoeca rosetta]|eukprot:XP_004997009.1 DEAD/DEAH box helicase [Salpingoeca rosetta]